MPHLGNRNSSIRVVLMDIVQPIFNNNKDRLPRGHTRGRPARPWGRWLCRWPPLATRQQGHLGKEPRLHPQLCLFYLPKNNTLILELTIVFTKVIIIIFQCLFPLLHHTYFLCYPIFCIDFYLSIYFTHSSSIKYTTLINLTQNSIVLKF